MSIAALKIKCSIGKIHIEFNPLKAAEETGIESLYFPGAEALMLGELPLHQKDPFDRMLMAQALANNHFLMTDDAEFRYFYCKII